jgi:hypothetical protein
MQNLCTTTVEIIIFSTKSYTDSLFFKCEFQFFLFSFLGDDKSKEQPKKKKVRNNSFSCWGGGRHPMFSTGSALDPLLVRSYHSPGRKLATCSYPQPKCQCKRSKSKSFLRKRLHQVTSGQNLKVLYIINITAWPALIRSCISEKGCTQTGQDRALAWISSPYILRNILTIIQYS